jgi:hypothetical protein
MRKRSNDSGLWKNSPVGLEPTTHFVDEGEEPTDADATLARVVGQS